MHVNRRAVLFSGKYRLSSTSKKMKVKKKEMNEEIVSRLKRVTRSTNRVYVNFDNIGKNTITLIPLLLHDVLYNVQLNPDSRWWNRIFNSVTRVDDLSLIKFLYDGVQKIRLKMLIYLVADSGFLTSCFAHLSRMNRSVFARPAIGSPWVQARSTSIWGSREDAFGRDRVPRPLHCACVAFPFRQSFSYTRYARASLPRSTSLSLLAHTMEGMDITAKFAKRREEWVERQNSGEERVVGTRGETRGTLGRGRRDESPAVECGRWRGGPACRAMPLNWIPALSSRQSDAGRAVSMAGFSRSFSPVLPS